MFYRIRNRMARRKLDIAQRKILATPPLQKIESTGPTVLSMIRSIDVHMYLTALKSFARHCPPSRVCVLNDGTLGAAELAALHEHIPFVEILELGDYQSSKYPTGGTWERLAALATLSGEGYTIQLDADTLTVGAIDEVVQTAREGIPFTLGSAQGTHLIGADEASRNAQSFQLEGDTHIQVAAEMALGQLAGADGLRYVRGCSGFTGIPVGALNVDAIAQWSARFSAVLGARWSEWGTEQFMSNFLIANMPGSRVLPHPKYATCPPQMGSVNAFVHFAGYCRFEGGRYQGLSQRVIEELQYQA